MTNLRRAATGSSKRSKGSKGEREVVALFRANGWERAARSPGSDSMRPYGVGDMSPWPGDLAFVEPFIVEVKWHESVAHPVKNGWVGQTVIRGFLRDLDKLWSRRVIGAPKRYPVLFARASFQDWRVFVLAYHFLGVTSDTLTSVHFSGSDREYIELTPDEFFLFAIELREGAIAWS